MAGLMPVATALERVLREAAGLRRGREGREGREDRAALDAVGRALAEDFRAPWSVPRRPTSVKDGYAVRARDLDAGETRLKLVGSKFAGPQDAGEQDDLDDSRPDSQADSVGEREAVYVTTGSSLPPGADAVIEVEKTRLVHDDAEAGAETMVVIEVPSGGVRPNLDVRVPGSDVQEGTLLIERGRALGAAEIGILAMFGRDTVSVIRPPRVGVLSTGDELVAAGSSLHGESIYDANRPMLLAKAQDAALGKAEVVDLGIIRDQDNKEERDGWLQDIIRQHDIDILITSGGVSMGARDFVRGALERCGTVHVERIFMKPGKPLIFATVGETLVFGLPGNPVSGAVTFDLLVAPALRKVAGWRDPLSTRIECRLATGIRLDPTRPEYHRARLARDEGTGGLLAHSTGFQRSSALASVLKADVLLELPSAGQFGAPEMPAGTLVPAIISGDLRAQNLLSRPLAARGPAVAKALVAAEDGAAARLGDAARAAGVPIDLVALSGQNLDAALRSALRDDPQSQQMALVVIPENCSFRELARIDEILAGEGCRRAIGISEVLRAHTVPCQGEESAWISPAGRLVLRLDNVHDTSRTEAQFSAVAGALRAVDPF